MRVLVIGASGMLGSDVVAAATSRGWQVIAPSLSTFDLVSPISSARLVAGELGAIDVCVNCAAFTAVDAAETERDSATALNAVGPSYLAQACQAVGTRLIHVSTDFVFDGQSEAPYTEADAPHPLGVYGSTKLQGEEAVLASGPSATVVRTAWLFGPNGSSFPRTMIRAWLLGKTLRVVADQRGTPTYTADLAGALCAMAAQNLPGGLYHCAGPEVVTWHELAKRAIQAYRTTWNLTDRAVEIAPIQTEDWPTPAVRPKYSALDSGKLAACGIGPLPGLDVSLSAFAERLPDPEALLKS